MERTIASSLERDDKRAAEALGQGALLLVARAVVALSLTLCMTTGALHAQVCDCEQAFRSVRAYFEENHPGYNAMDAPERTRMNAAADAIAQEVARHRPEAECIL
jgi:hypothetical protein